ncbi:magnesium and cobalt transport protein CorA [Eoetvoesiella caeni]|uniref:Magnesium transporter n=1 Tax=Eoetvoesiella caeni TaxID=645616 RepID=A0A366H651_9BURK|nr:magnesium and cobalt transport protein CorA [Eoetvoesiella caeni]MCI2809952.1 magnesium and cobalt transport protein CorA [Eoetvoesiella caeni]NYT55828.1 magnesium and cobalt transport protein CorA [Eoetvoesiella caeni]RBP37561.1 magnesium transporter [Eoetvoesiella caeni]
MAQAAASDSKEAIPADSPPELASPVVASVLYRRGQAAQDVPLEEIGRYKDGCDGLLWIGLKEPQPDVIRNIGQQLGWSRRAVDEIIEPHRRPKIIEYDALTQIVAITVEVAHLRPAFGETQLLLGTNFLVTVRRGATIGHAQLRHHLEGVPDFLARGSDYVASALLDLLVDHYLEATGRMETGVEGVEHQFLLRGFHPHDVRKLYRQRRDLLRIFNAIAPMAEICRRLARVEMKHVDADARPYFGEVGDRVMRVTELVNSLREALAFAFEAGLMIGQAQQTDITKKLASWAAILAVPTAVAGIYGMNFKYMPELDWTYGYPMVLAATFAACGILYWRFKKAKWL